MTASLRETPLHALHGEAGARMVPFAGYSMPLHYPLGLLKEHLHTRRAAGLFDVSHMGQIAVRARSGDPGDAARALETVLPIDVLDLGVGRQRYGVLTLPGGGILDDLMLAHLGDHYLLVVNAANKAADLAHLLDAIGTACTVEPVERALLALQGPGADAALARHLPAVAGMRFMDARTIAFGGEEGVVVRSGYTGEDGFEVALPAASAVALARALLAEPEVKPVGLGARDSLRLEAGLCLHGSDIGPETSPVEAGLAWAIPKVRRLGGDRAGGFPGAERILAELEEGPARLRVGLKPEGRTPVRAGAALYAAADAAEAAGRVTSGGFGPSLEAPIAMGVLPRALAVPGAQVFAEVRGQRLPCAVVPLPFRPAGFKRS
ncbi:MULTISPECIES: glycine cleavage system aminomethyltransferase GcvT [Methylobacterium]|jgi:aminomethyltransferase|uniref:glycine cleavage system aminomethyltransferase GcvT n=2 Tax=Methylobacteriaceae TaxID=119045 RepID=UPI0008EC4F45|nr:MULTISPECIES: glycine cleavage system aminomethyltransferase GcvT [Methylobacterium]MBK3395159.1 glycine cleavage system aminomethyltransferase GcvT [Methylobacterium ajmalii]MBK3412053.1 glycine cleavage system aminomethyltransferase GcvT [Methylobacterium ajmalii]MBZ6411589.1 glycine cleavage system aminomethyltransferase GcvT [Methylobacterium sp.]SFE40145.1 aminomethyltransferase [Methylobacterium sp. yr596]